METKVIFANIEITLIRVFLNLKNIDYCDTTIYPEGHTMCKYKEDAPNERCTEGGVEIISRKICDQVMNIIHILYGLTY